MNRITIARRRHHPVVWISAGTAGFLVLDLCAWVLYAAVHVALALAPVVVLAAAGWAGWRLWQHHRGARRFPPVTLVSAQPVAETGELARLRAELGQACAERDDLRRQVQKLEDDAARHDQIIEELERAAGRPVEAVLASYCKIQGLYGTGGPQ